MGKTQSHTRESAAAPKGGKPFGQHRTHHTHAVILLVVGADGKLSDVFLKNTVGQVYLADHSVIDGLPDAAAREKAIMLGVEATPIGHLEFEALLEGLINPEPKEEEKEEEEDGETNSDEKPVDSTPSVPPTPPSAENAGGLAPSADPLPPPLPPVAVAPALPASDAKPESTSTPTSDPKVS